MITICTFNVNNLYARYRFGETYPGDVRGASADGDPTTGFLPLYTSGAWELVNTTQRRLAAEAITAHGLPDVVCLQEVESLLALRTFNETFLDSAYTSAVLVDSRDFRQIDVGVLSRLPIDEVRTHVDERDPAEPTEFLWSRDCLELDVVLPRRRVLTLFVNHLKSKFVDFRVPAEEQAAARAESDTKRRRQADRVAELVHTRFPGRSFQTRLFAVVGDLNDEKGSPPLKTLVGSSGLTDVVERIAEPTDRWTHWWRSENQVSHIDHVLVSPALAALSGTPHIERGAVGFSRVLTDGMPGPRLTRYVSNELDPGIDVDFRFARFAEVTPAAAASDHCPVILEIDV